MIARKDRFTSLIVARAEPRLELNLMIAREPLSQAMDFSLFTTLTEKPGVTGSYREHYEGLLDLFEAADCLGFDAAFVAEHHTAGNPQVGYPLIPNPAVFLAAVAMRTKHLKLGPGVSILPFRNPLNVVEDYAMVDQLSGGRLIMGIGSGDLGLAHELEGYCIPSEERIPRYMEGLRVIEAAWNGAALTHEGNFFKYEKASLNIALHQRPGPPIHIAVSRPEAAYAVARHGYPIYAVPYPGVDTIIEHYRKGCADGDMPYSPDMHYFMYNTYIADTEAIVRERYAEAAARAGNEPDWKKFDSMIADGNWLVGDPDFIADRLIDIRAAGVRKLMLAMDFVVGMPMSEVLRSLDLFASAVVPRFEAGVSGYSNADRFPAEAMSVG